MVMKEYVFDFFLIEIHTLIFMSVIFSQTVQGETHIYIYTHSIIKTGGKILTFHEKKFKKKWGITVDKVKYPQKEDLDII